MASSNLARLRAAKAQLELIERNEAARRAYLEGQRRIQMARRALPLIAAYLGGFLTCQVVQFLLWRAAL